MNTSQLNTESLRPQVLQHALQQISSLEDAVSTECCIICLSDLADKCEALPCRHCNFDFLCLVTWLEQRAVCPLCNSHVSEVRYDLSKDGQQGKVYMVPQLSKGSSMLGGQHGGASNEDESRFDIHRSARLGLPHQDNIIQIRQLIYRDDLYSFHVGSNRRQPAETTYRELSPQLFLTDPELVSRARLWLRRELRVFGFLTSGDLTYDRESSRRRRTSNSEFLREYIVAILKTMDMHDSSGQTEKMIQEYLGRKNTPLFLHELKSWLRSPYRSLKEWDCNVQYKDSHAIARVPPNTEGEMARGAKCVLKYYEPADARRPPPSQAWRLYIFKGEDTLEFIELWERSAWLFGREEGVVDVVTSHPSCSGQHAALQFRYVATHARESGEHQERQLLKESDKDCIRLYLMDLGSTHHTRLNGTKIESHRYVELRHKDVIEFGGSKREYVIILPFIDQHV